MHKQGRVGGACMQQFWLEEATKHHLKHLWDAGTGKFPLLGLQKMLNMVFLV